jgi:hypothetical protein
MVLRGCGLENKGDFTLATIPLRAKRFGAYPAPFSEFRLARLNELVRKSDKFWEFSQPAFNSRAGGIK